MGKPKSVLTGRARVEVRHRDLRKLRTSRWLSRRSSITSQDERPSTLRRAFHFRRTNLKLRGRGRDRARASAKARSRASKSETNFESGYP